MTYADYLRSPEWKAVSGARRRMDENKCTCCGSIENTDVHHVRYPANWYDTTTDDLVTLCHDCHLTAHRWREIFDKHKEGLPLTKNGFIIWGDSKAGQRYHAEALRLVATACWKRNIFHTDAVMKYRDELMKAAGTQKARIDGGDLMEEIAFAKDCYIANSKPVFNKGRRKAKAQSHTRYK